jgi:hypothetical protein
VPPLPTHCRHPLRETRALSVYGQEEGVKQQVKGGSGGRGGGTQGD